MTFEFVAGIRLTLRHAPVERATVQIAPVIMTPEIPGSASCSSSPTWNPRRGDDVQRSLIATLCILPLK